MSTTRKFCYEERYEVALGRVYALLIDPDVQRDKALYLGARRATCQRLADGRLELRELRRALPLGRGAIESVIVLTPSHGRDGDVADAAHARVTWSQRFADLALPVEVDGVIELGAGPLTSAAPAGCTLVFRGEVRTRLPLLGSVVTRGIVRAIIAAKQREHGFYRERLERIGD